MMLEIIFRLQQVHMHGYFQLCREQIYQLQSASYQQFYQQQQVNSPTEVHLSSEVSGANSDTYVDLCLSNNGPTVVSLSRSPSPPISTLQANSAPFIPSLPVEKEMNKSQVDGDENILNSEVTGANDSKNSEPFSSSRTTENGANYSGDEQTSLNGSNTDTPQSPCAIQNAIEMVNRNVERDVAGNPEGKQKTDKTAKLKKQTDKPKVIAQDAEVGKKKKRGRPPNKQAAQAHLPPTCSLRSLLIDLSRFLLAPPLSTMDLLLLRRLQIALPLYHYRHHHHRL